MAVPSIWGRLRTGYTLHRDVSLPARPCPLSIICPQRRSYQKCRNRESISKLPFFDAIYLYLVRSGHALALDVLVIYPTFETFR